VTKEALPRLKKLWRRTTNRLRQPRRGRGRDLHEHVVCYRRVGQRPVKRGGREGFRVIQEWRWGGGTDLCMAGVAGGDPRSRDYERTTGSSGLRQRDKMSQLDAAIVGWRRSQGRPLPLFQRPTCKIAAEGLWKQGM